MTGLLKVFLALACLAGMAPLALGADPSSQVGRLNLISGAVSFQPATVDEWSPASLNYPITVGDHLWTDSGAKAELHLGNAVLRLGANTEFSFLSLDDQTVQVSLTQGTLQVVVRGLGNGAVFEIDTPNSSVRILQAGAYRFDVQPNGETDLTVRTGLAELHAGQNAANLSGGQAATVSGFDANSFRFQISRAASADDWDNWCSGRDRLERQYQSSPYVSSEMIGSEDLGRYGTWAEVSGYGPGWTPNNVPAGWVPYRDGHWSWVEPWGWTWIDDSSWGFAPFHYGRWAFAGARWIWFPGTTVQRPVYAPALVVFIGGSDWSPNSVHSIGWFPLAPHEVYYPPYHSSPEYVQRINRESVPNIAKLQSVPQDSGRIKYVNNSDSRAVTVVSSQAFVQSQHVGRSVMQLPPAALARAPVTGTQANLAPQHESIVAGRLPSQRAVSQPPAALAKRQVQTRTVPQNTRAPFVQNTQSVPQNRQPAVQPKQPPATRAPSVQQKPPQVNREPPVQQKPPQVNHAPAVQQKPPQATRAPSIQQKPPANDGRSGKMTAPQPDNQPPAVQNGPRKPSPSPDPRDQRNDSPGSRSGRLD